MFARFLELFPIILTAWSYSALAGDDRCRHSGLRYCEVLRPWLSSPRQPSLELLPGDNATLRCEVTQSLGQHAAGAIWMGWFKDNSTSSVHLGEFTYSEKNAKNFSRTYTLSNVRPHDSGTFICQAKSTGNLLRGNSTGVHIMVAEPLLETPNITADTPTPDAIDLGANVTLRCETQGYPHPLYNWTINGKGVSTNHSSATDHMTIRGFSQSDEGLYACVVWNIAGEKQSQQLQLTAKPPDGSLPTVWIIVIAVVSFVTVFVIVILIVVLIYRRTQRWKHCRLQSESDGEASDFADDIPKLYDFCVLCSKDDESWAKEKIVDKLEETKRRGYFQYRDDIGGSSMFQYLSEGVANSKYVILVYSKSAVSDEWFKKGSQTAIAERLDKNLISVIPVLRKGFTRKNLPIELKDTVPLQVEEPKFFQRLQRSLSQDSDYGSKGPSPANSEESIVDRISVI